MRGVALIEDIVCLVEVGCHVKVRVLAASANLLSIATVTVGGLKDGGGQFLTHFVFFELVF